MAARRGTAGRRSRLERSAQEDPFLSDAWEGSSQNPQKEHIGRINDLNAKIAERAQSDKKEEAPSWFGFRVWQPRRQYYYWPVLGWRWLMDSSPEDEPGHSSSNT